MGKGDKKSRRGKIVNGTYGKRRPKKESNGFVATQKTEGSDAEAKPVKKAPAAKAESAKKPVAKKPAAKKPAAKKTEE